MFESILQAALNAIISSSFMAIIAVGLVLIVGVMQIVNFAHGELYMVGAYTLWYLYMETGFPFAIAVLCAVLVPMLVGFVMERVLFRPMRGNLLGGLIMSVGMVFILKVAAVWMFGEGLMKHIVSPFKEVWHVFGLEAVVIPNQRLLVLGVSAAVMLGFWFFLRRTKTGWALRACTQDPEAAALQGISIGKVSIIAMAISAGMAGIGGAMMAPLVIVDPHMGATIIITAFIVMIVGGMGSLGGAVIAAVIYSFIHTFITTYVDGVIATIFGLLLMFVVLMVKPTGIMGTRDKV
ncbi:MAG: branched-chain amino acid ABC transporter permease [Alphaproteobacteria bacterium]